MEEEMILTQFLELWVMLGWLHCLKLWGKKKHQHMWCICILLCVARKKRQKQQSVVIPPSKALLMSFFLSTGLQLLKFSASASSSTDSWPSIKHVVLGDV